MDIVIGREDATRMDAIVCGIDPGLGITGYAVLRSDGQRHEVIDAGACRGDEELSLAMRLASLERDISSIVEEHRPMAIAVEQLYSHYKHPRTAILMGHARGVILMAAARQGVKVHDYAATKVKRFMTGNGHASKEQVQQAVKVTLGLDTAPEPFDVADALAIAVCCASDICRNNAKPVAV